MARNSAPIRQLASGRWQLRYRHDGAETSESFDTRAEAAQAWHAKQADQARGTWIDPKTASITFRSFAEDWRRGHVGSLGTAEMIERHLRLHVYPTIGDRPLAGLRRSHLQQLVAALTTALAASSVRVVVQHMNQVLNAAVEDRVIPSNPGRGLKLPRVDGAELIIPTPDEVVAIAATIDARYRALVVVGAGLGLRQGEAFGLTRSRVNFLAGRTVRIDRQLVKGRHNRFDLGALKTSNSYRTIPAPANVLEVLGRHIEQWPTAPDELLFTSELGRHLRRGYWNDKFWRPAVVAAGVPELTFHGLRHFFASALIRRGLSVKAVAARLGDTEMTTLKTYSHLWHDDDDRTREAIEELLAV